MTIIAQSLQLIASSHGTDLTSNSNFSQADARCISTVNTRPIPIASTAHSTVSELRSDGQTVAASPVTSVFGLEPEMFRLDLPRICRVDIAFASKLRDSGQITRR